jgi:hypothetical protein
VFVRHGTYDAESESESDGSGGLVYTEDTDVARLNERAYDGLFHGEKQFAKMLSRKLNPRLSQKESTSRNPRIPRSLNQSEREI